MQLNARNSPITISEHLITCRFHFMEFPSRIFSPQGIRVKSVQGNIDYFLSLHVAQGEESTNALKIFTFIRLKTNPDRGMESFRTWGSVSWLAETETNGDIGDCEFRRHLKARLHHQGHF